MIKAPVFLVFVGCFFASINGFAQTPQAVEADLLKTLHKIQNWNNSNFATPTQTDPDSLDVINNIFQKKLIYYGQRYPAAFNRVFRKIGGLSAENGLFNILSWDTYTGGTQHVFQTIILYRSEKNKSFLADTISFSNSYDTLYTLTIGNTNYYLVTYHQILDLYASWRRYQSILY